jgi:hypothetical protein
VGADFGRYAKEDVSLRVARLMGQPALAAHVAGAAQPSYFVLLAWADSRLKDIRDVRYVDYIAAEAAFVGA